MNRLWLYSPILALMAAACGPFKPTKSHPGDDKTEFRQSGTIEEDSSVTSEFSYLEVAAEESSAILQDVKQPDEASPRKDVVSSGDSKPKDVLRDGPEVCSELSTQRCISCCEDFYRAGGNRWDQCVQVCVRGTAQVMSEY